MRSDFGIVLEGGALTTATTSQVQSSPDLFTLRLAGALGEFVPVWIASSAIKSPLEGNRFLVVPRNDLPRYVHSRRGYVVKMGYDPRLTLRSVRLARSLGWKTAFYVFDHHEPATRGYGWIKRLAAEVWFTVGFWSLCLVDRVLIVNPRCIKYLPSPVRGKLIMTRVGTEMQASPASHEREAGLFVFAGSLTPENLVIEIIKAFRSLGETSARLVIFGDGPLRDEVVELIATTPRCRYAGLRPFAEVKEAQDLAWCSIALRKRSVPTSDFSFPSKLVETLASGAVALSSPNELVADLAGISIQVESDTVESISGGLTKAMNLSTTDHRAMAEAAYASMRSNFGWRSIARDLVNRLG